MSTDNMFRELDGLYEPSAIQQLADGRFLVAEDEKEHSFSLVTIAKGRVDSTPLRAQKDGLLGGVLGGLLGGGFWKFDDLEGLALDASGFVYAVTSHSRDDDGNEKKSRERLVRFRIDGDRVEALVVVGGLKAALTAAHPVLAAAAAVRDVKAGGGGLNIEALDLSADQRQLLIGFRSPLQAGKAIIACVENMQAIFDNDEAPRVAPTLHLLDLGGSGIRGMSHVPALDGYLVIGGPSGQGDVPFELWFWSGRPEALARRVSVAGLDGFAHAEGICPAVLDGGQRILVVSDDGNRKQGQPARYLALELGQVQIAT
jgi:hypothetical protein